MAYDDDKKINKPNFSGQRLYNEVENPAQADAKGQSSSLRRQEIEDSIMRIFFTRMPSNYVSQAQGPFYTNMFRAVAKQLAEFQVEAELASDDPKYDLTRPEFMYQVLGRIVFPNAMRPESKLVDVDGDVSLRDFLREMVLLLLEGSRKDPVERGVGLLSDLGMDIVETVAHERKKASGVGLEDQFEIEINAVAPKQTVTEGAMHWHRIRVDNLGNGRTYGTFSTLGDEDYHFHEIKDFVIQPYVSADQSEHSHEFLQGFPDNTFTLQHNVHLILKALKPAHLLYQYRHMFVEFFGEIFEDQATYDYFTWKYEDLRKNWRGAKSVTGQAKTAGNNKCFLVDPNRDFSSILPGAPVEISDESNQGEYFVKEVHTLPYPTDSVARAYTTSPTGLSGIAVVENGRVQAISDQYYPEYDTELGGISQDEIFTFLEGPNAGSYRIKMVLGINGGLPGTGNWTSDKVELAPSILEIRPPMPYLVDSQTYVVGVDRLGASVPNKVDSEDCSEQFYV